MSQFNFEDDDEFNKDLEYNPFRPSRNNKNVYKPIIEKYLYVVMFENRPIKIYKDINKAKQFCIEISGSRIETVKYIK